MIIEKSYKKPKNLWLLLIPVSLITVVLLYAFYAYNNFDSYSKEYLKREFPKMLDQYNWQSRTADHSSIFKNAALHTIKGHLGFHKNSDVESINVNIKFKHLQKLKAKRNEVLNETIFLFSSSEDYVPATIEYQNKKIRVKLRLKGDGNDHLKDKSKWSFRIKTRKGAEFKGMRKFSIQHPKTRGYTYEAVFHKMMKSQGVMALNYDFISVSINGESIGIMALEEHFSKELLERQEQKENIIIKASEVKYWEYFLQQILYRRKMSAKGKKPISSKDLDLLRRAYSNALNVPFEVYGGGKIAKSEALQYQRKVGVGLLRAVVQGDIKPSEAFDVTSAAKFAAGLWFWESHHPSNVVNVRYYLNPYTLKLEVIAFDANAQEKWNFYTVFLQKHGRQLMQLIMSDPIIDKAFRREVKTLYQKVKDGYIDELRSDADSYRTKLAVEFPLLPLVDFKGIEQRIHDSYPKIQKGTYFLKPKKASKKAVYFPADFEMPGIVYAYVTNTNSGKQLELQNILADDVDITSLEVSVNGKNTAIEKLIDGSLPIRLLPTKANSSATPVIFPLTGVSIDDKVVVTGSASPSKQKRDYEFVSLDYDPLLKKHPLTPVSAEEFAAINSFVTIDKNKRTIKIASGEHYIFKMWVLPTNYSLHIDRGTTINFSKGAGLIVNGGSTFNGSVEQPIVLKSAQPGKENAWGGIAFIRGEKSVWQHVNVHNTDFTRYGGWGLTGAITFYKTDIDLRSVKFIGSVAEDALNIVRSNFTISKSSIIGARSDGFDGDFSKGTIKNSQFKDIGGDGIDFSGSTVEVVSSEFDRIFDKAISAGEGTKIDINQVVVRNSGTGVASKDNSFVTVSRSKFVDINYSSFMSYIKKPEYGGAVLTARDVEFEQKNLSLVVQKDSELTVNGASIKPMDVDIEKLYDEGHMKK